MKSDRIEKIIKQHEGYRKHPYKDTVNKLTIGYGRNLDDVGISRHEASVMLSNDIIKAKEDVKRTIGEKTYKKLSDVRREVLIDMMLNMGYYSFNTFKKMIRYIKKGLYYKASREMLKSKWAEQVKNRARHDYKAFKDNEWPV